MEVQQSKPTDVYVVGLDCCLAKMFNGRNTDFACIRKKQYKYALYISVSVFSYAAADNIRQFSRSITFKVGNNTN